MPAGAGVSLDEDEAAGSAAWATMELPGTVAASRPPEAARNRLRSIDEIGEDELAGDALASEAVLNDEFLGHESWGRDFMRVTSANAAMEQTNDCPAALYDGMKRKQGENRFSKGIPVERGETGIEKT